MKKNATGYIYGCAPRWALPPAQTSFNIAPGATASAPSAG
ncbi:hypothetical protein A2U01_0059397, partial [Trifolium medium]|nr:hypothetical protein [Trifolium medium]